MWRKSDSKRFVPTDIGRRFRSAAFHDPAHDRIVTRLIVRDIPIQAATGRVLHAPDDACPKRG